MALVGVVAVALRGAPPVDTMPMPSSASPSPSGAPSEDVRVIRVAVLDALHRRSIAVVAHDAAAFDRTGPARALYRRTTMLPVRRWSYALGSLAVSGTTATASAILHWQLDGDQRDDIVALGMTFRRAGQLWQVSAETPIGPVVPLWAVGDLSVARGRRSLVIGVAGPGEAMPDLGPWRTVADRAVAAVGQVVTDRWRHAVTVVVPASVRGMTLLTGRTDAELRSVAAVTRDGSAMRPTERQATEGAARVYVNPLLMSSASGEVRRIVVTHEVVHVATGSAHTSATPLWFEEGFAVLVSYRKTGVSDAQAAGDALRAIRRGSLPAGLPGSDQFSGAGALVAYGESMLACRLLQRDLGWAGLLALYRGSALGPQSTPRLNFARALRRATGASTSEFQRRWRAALVATAFQPWS